MQLTRREKATECDVLYIKHHRPPFTYDLSFNQTTKGLCPLLCSINAASQQQKIFW